jgi:DNA-directed RNA polymerase subunit L
MGKELMKVSVLNMKDTELEIVVEGEGHTLLNLLRDLLLDDESVVFASYLIDHPMRSSPRLTLRTNGKNALSVLIENTSKMASIVTEFNEKFVNLIAGQK